MNNLEMAIKDLLKAKIKSLGDLDNAKRKISKKYNLTTPSNVNLLKAYHNLLKTKRLKPNKNLEYLLIKRRVRSLSGIVNVSILTKPYDCPGNCLYCPSEKGIPKSYLKKEPAVQRAIFNHFNPYKQIKSRLESLKATGHPTDKIELRIIGGTWSYYPKKYQSQFILRCFDACNSKKLRSLEKAQKLNEKAKHRIIGITIETRPDYINEEEIKWLRELGITRVELGVQSVYDNVLKLNKRGNTVADIIKATKILKEAGFKVSFQIMPNLPGSTFQKDIKMFEELFSNPDFKPDLLKIYPLALVKEAPLYKLYKDNQFKPYGKAKLIKLLVEIKKLLPYYVRVERVIRDIPSEYIIEGGVKISNLRELVQKEVKCKCIRCREIKDNYGPEKIYLFRQDYDASDGKEIFLSFENTKRTKLYALLRLRISKVAKNNPPQAMVRELHTYGKMLSISSKDRGRTSVLASQHKGLGKKLMKEAEKITKKEFHLKKIAVISGIGVRGYYRKLGYRLDNTYMIKKLV